MDRKAEAVNLYAAGLSHREVAERVGVARITVARWLKELGISPRNAPTTNTGFFQDIDSEEKAYWLGMLAADGCLSVSDRSKKYVKLGLKWGDLQHVEAFRDAVGGSQKVVRTGKSHHPQASVAVGSWEMVRDLMALGVTPRKKYTTRRPSPDLLPLPLERHFWRGVVDGDGSFYIDGRGKAVVKVSGSERLCGDFRDWVISVCGSSPNLCLDKATDTWFLQVASREGIAKLVIALYQDSTVSLPRKHAKADQVLAHVTRGNRKRIP